MQNRILYLAGAREEWEDLDEEDGTGEELGCGGTEGRTDADLEAVEYVVECVKTHCRLNTDKGSSLNVTPSFAVSLSRALFLRSRSLPPSVNLSLQDISITSLSRLSTLLHSNPSTSYGEERGVEVSVTSQLVEVRWKEDGGWDEVEEEGLEGLEEELLGVINNDNGMNVNTAKVREGLEEGAKMSSDDVEDIESVIEGLSQSVNEVGEENADKGLTYVHAYRVRVHNGGERNVQVLGRNWCITTEDGREESVRQPTTGVVGMFPVVEPGGTFEYTSGTSVDCGRGRMRGSVVVGVVGEGVEGRKVGEGGVEGFNGGKGNVWEVEVGEFRLRGEEGGMQQ